MIRTKVVIFIATFYLLIYNLIQIEKVQQFLIKKIKYVLILRFGERVQRTSSTIIHMTQKEVIDIVKESNLWESLTQTEKQEAINHALKITQLSIPEEKTRTRVGDSG